ncbi:MAG: transcriptional regulator [Pseudorhizobium sp.]
MKKSNRNFVVEYKSGRRKSDKGSNSIWGNIDLGSVAQDVDDASMPAVAPGADEVKTVPFAGPRQASIVTSKVGQPTTVPDLQEDTMADEEHTGLAADVPTVAEPEADKKVRKPRATKPVTETSAVDVSTEPAAGKPKRGRKPKAGNTAGDTKRSPTKRAPKAEPVALAAQGEAIDEMADLLQLEEENKTLRRQLAEKLRAENEDLKRRLSLG